MQFKELLSRFEQETGAIAADWAKSTLFGFWWSPERVVMNTTPVMSSSSFSGVVHPDERSAQRPPTLALGVDKTAMLEYHEAR
ncbi:hypothetical protein I6B53_10640 [Schaalia sp. 19OD2882]|uniref:hypothetical protein n=1 Tax=Schaalia sp. 19OD2882 TaxID=2794089 RepID=UPI001C1F1EDB|nr:hypothetical protein [Schaalia sp. 19OD2882]QWW19515.1 hypothetical protein I6B53_10640 [Schaalia sp. 19OD2882]